jgi:hypothetical protein
MPSPWLDDWSRNAKRDPGSEPGKRADAARFGRTRLATVRGRCTVEG